ncbi:reverse transcriptase domain-containing protein [Tanacetum coccineum]
MTLELANRDICTPKGIARDVFVPVGKFTFPADFVIVDYESDPRVPLILGRPFLRTACALIDVHGEEMILRDGNERLILNMRNDTSSYSNQPHQESINMIDVYNVSHEEILKDLFATNHLSGNPTSSLTSHTDLTSPEVNDDIFDPEEDIIENLLNLDKTKDLPPYHDNQASGNPTPILEPETKSLSSFPPHLFSSRKCSQTSSFAHAVSRCFLRFAGLLFLLCRAHATRAKLASHQSTFPPGNDDLPFDAESDLLELEYLLNHDPIKDMDSILEDSVDENSLDNNLVDTILMNSLFYPSFCFIASFLFFVFSTSSHIIHSIFPTIYVTVNDDTYDDPFDSKEEKIKDSKILIDELDLPGSSDFLPFPECDSVFYEDFSEVDALSSTNNEDKLSKSPKFLKARWRFFLALTKRTSESWMFRVSTSIPLDKLKYGGIGSS